MFNYFICFLCFFAFFSSQYAQSSDGDQNDFSYLENYPYFHPSAAHVSQFLDLGEGSGDDEEKDYDIYKNGIDYKGIEYKKWDKYASDEENLEELPLNSFQELEDQNEEDQNDQGFAESEGDQRHPL